MHPYFQAYLANERREELLRTAEVMRPFNNQHHASTLTHNRHIFLYLLLGLPIVTDKQSRQNVLPQSLEARYHAALRMTALIALALGILIGSLLASRFGLLPAVLLDSTVVLVVTALILLRLRTLAM